MAYDLDELAKVSEGYVGAEIEQGVIDGMYLSFNENERDVTTADIVTALKRQVPMSVSSKEIIDGLRRWLSEGRAQSASYREPEQAQQNFVPIHIPIQVS